MTNDVELISLAKNREDKNIVKDIYKKGLPRILDLFSKYDIEATFYYTGNIVKLQPEVVEIVKEEGHEIGCHSYSHDPNEALDLLPYEAQYKLILKSKKIIEEVAGNIVSFKAPELRINQYTIKALEDAGFKIDSSVASQRFDGPLSYGTKNKFKWLFAPRKPYFPSYDSPFIRGNSKILEIPVSALLIPYIGTTMRISPPLLKFIEKFIFREARSPDKPILFIFHPNECIEYGEIEKTLHTQGVSGVFRDVIRQNIKMRNLGEPAIKLLEEVIKRAKRYGFEFISVKRYGEIYLKRMGCK